MYDRAIPDDCYDDQEFGFMFPCHDKISGPLKRSLKIIGTTGLVLAALEAIGLICAFVLYSDFATSYGDGGRLGEQRRLLHEGNLPATQYARASS